MISCAGVLQASDQRKLCWQGCDHPYEASLSRYAVDHSEPPYEQDYKKLEQAAAQAIDFVDANEVMLWSLSTRRRRGSN